MLDDAAKDVVVTSIAFGDGVVEIAYFENKDQSERAGIMKSLIMDRNLVRDDIEEVLDILQDIVDKGLLEIRSPAPSLDPRKRIASRREVNEEVE